MSDELDLTTEAAAVEPDLVSYQTAPFDPAPKRERLRGVIAISLVGLLVGIVVMTFISLATGWVAFPDVKGVLDLVLAPVIGLVGAVTGFYFGERSKD